MTTANDWSFHFDDPVPKFLDLPNDIMERICQYLPAQADKSQACLIHSAWQPAAMNVLWEWPRFRYPNNLRAFMNIIRHSKRLALLVHDIHLVFPDTTVSVFAPVAKSNLERHKSMDFYLTKPELINMIVKVCEKLQTLTIYGWNIDPGFLENLGITGTNLTNLHIIGANPRSNTISIHRLLSRLTSLSLDGNFKLSEAFVGQLVNRETRLTHIQLSLSGLDRNTLMRICNNRNHLKLENLALTDAENIQDSDVEEVVKSFPKLKTLCIEGAVQLTDLSLFYAVSNCNDLMELYIRCDSRALNNPRGLISATFDPLSSHIDINLRRLVLENVLYDDTIIDYLANSLAKLKVIGLKNCPNMTNRTLEALVMSCNKLQAFYIRDCPGIGLEAFTELKEVTPATSASLTTFYIANSGPTTPASVYNLCVSSPKLHTLSIEGYTNINDSVVGTFNTVNPVGGSKNTDLVVLDQKSIDALINTDHPDLMYIGESRTLSGYQISLLANRLEMSYHDLIGIMDDVAEEENNLLNGRGSVRSNSRGSIRSSGRASVQQTIMNNQSMTRMNGMSPRSSIDMKGKKAVNRMAALKGEATRPDTPSLWSSAYMQHGQDFFGDSVPEENYNDVFNGSTVGNDMTLLSGGDNTGYKESESESDRTNDSDVSYDSYNDGYKEDNEKEEEEDEDGEEEEEEDDGLDARDNFYGKKISPNQTNNNGTHIQDWSDLTGENGFSNMALGGWGGDSPFQNSSKATQNETPGGLTTKRKSQLDESYPDQSNTDYIQQWRETSTNGVPQKKHSLTQNRNQHSLANNDADGWGEVDKFVPWDDLRKQGYNAELLEQQKKTSFWQPGEQKWNTPNGEGQAELETHGSGPKEKNPVNFTSLVSQNPTNTKRSDSCVSSQGSVNLDEGADIILKTTAEGILAQSNSQRKPDQTNIKQSVQDWNILKEPVEREESATDGWSHLAKNSKSRFSRTQRINGTNTRKIIPPNQMAGNWGSFQQMNQTKNTNSANQVNQIEYTNPRTLTPIRPSSSLQRTPSLRNSYTPEPLIQTQDPMSLTPEPVTLDLLVDTEDEPSHTQPLKPTSSNNNLWNNNNVQASSLNDDLASLDMQTKSPIKELEVDFLNWSSSNSEKIPEKPLFVEPIVGTGHDTSDIEIDNFDRLISETSQTSSQKKGENGYLDDISQLMSPSPEKPLIAPLLSNNPTTAESIQNELLGSSSALPSLDGATDVSSIASSPAPDNEIFSTTISVETKKYEVQKISLDENSDIKAVVQDFCRQYEMEDLVDRIFIYVSNCYTKKRTKRLFKKGKKKAAPSS